MRSRHALRQPSLGAATAPGPAPGRPNLWPDAELPELRPAFQALGRLVVAAGLLLARRCDAYAAGRASAVPTLASSLCFAPMRARARAAGRAVPCCAVQRLLVWTSTRPRRLARGRRSAAARRVRQQPPRHASNTCMCVRAGATSCTAARQAAPPCAGPGAAARPCLGLHDVLARSPCHKGRLLHYYPLPPAPGARPADAPDRGARGGGGGAGGADIGGRTCAGDGEGALGSEACGEAGAGGEAGAPEAAADDWCGWHRDHGSLTGAARRRARRSLFQRCRWPSCAVTQEPARAAFMLFLDMQRHLRRCADSTCGVARTLSITS